MGSPTQPLVLSAAYLATLQARSGAVATGNLPVPVSPPPQKGNSAAPSASSAPPFIGRGRLIDILA